MVSYQNQRPLSIESRSRSFEHADTESTAYDATYLWLAQLLGAPIVTLDRRLAEAARSLGLP